MTQLKKILASLSLSQRIAVVLALCAVGGGLWWLTHWRKEADFKALYTGLSQEDAAAVVQKLKESGTEFRLSDTGGVVSAPSAKVAELRLEMAAAGLPKTGRVGYEIFDKTNLGATEFVEQINFQRAVEGELERSVSALSEVEQARVHISFAKQSVFVESREQAKASVLVRLKPEVRLSDRNVTAIAHLVASAVEGLAPEAVSVLDMQGNLLSRPARAADEAASEAGLDYRRNVERDLLQKVSSTLDPLLGHDKYRANVLVDCDRTSAEQSEDIVDPARSVMVSSQKTEEVVANGTPAGGVPGTSSNLPRSTARPPASNSTNRRTENVVYQSTRTTKTTKMPQGGIKRVWVAVLLDQAISWEGVGAAARRVLLPPSPDTLQTVHDVVATVVGFTSERGDQITVETLPFEQTMRLPPPEAPRPAPAARPTTISPAVQWQDLVKDPKWLIGAAAGAAVLIVALIAMALKGKKKKRASKAEVAPPQELPAQAIPAQPAIGSAALTQQIEANLAKQAALQEQAELASLASIKMPVLTTKKTEVLTKQIREEVRKDATAPARVVQTWLQEGR